MGYLYFWIRDRLKLKRIMKEIKNEEEQKEEIAKMGVSFTNPLWFLLCSLFDCHAGLLIISAYEFTTITSAMLLEDFTIPTAVVLALVFLKVRYRKLHYIAVALCLSGTATSICNDIFIKNKGP